MQRSPVGVYPAKGALNSRDPAIMLAWLRENIKGGYAVFQRPDGTLAARRIERWGE